MNDSLSESQLQFGNAKQLVRKGHDSCALTYAANRAEDDCDQIKPLLATLSDGVSVLDLGCGSGVPIASRLSAQYRVTSVDISESMLSLARANVPDAQFICADIAHVNLPAGSFDAVVAILVMFHMPKEEHGKVFERVFAWLRTGGYFLVTLTREAAPPRIRTDFFGTRMYWSKLGYGESMALLKSGGFQVVRERIVGPGYGPTRQPKDASNPLVLLRKPTS